MAMNNNQNGSGESQHLLRPRFFPRQLVTAADLTAGQEYFRDRLQRHNRWAHGCGVVCGLEVLPASTGEGASYPTVIVTAGYALSPRGDEIHVGEQQTIAIDCVENMAGDCLDLANMPTGQRVYVAIRHVDTEVNPVPALPERCAPSTTCEHSRVRDDFRIACLSELPDTCLPPQIDCHEALRDLFHRDPPPTREDVSSLFTCPSETGGSWVVLAALDLDPSGSVAVDYGERSQILSTQTLLELLRCIPIEAPPPPPSIAAIAPDRGLQASVLEATISGRRLTGATSVSFSGSGVLSVVLPAITATMSHAGVRSVAFRPDGRYLVTAGGDATVRVWEVSTGQQVAARIAVGTVNAIAFSADGRYLALATDTPGGDVQVWETTAEPSAWTGVARWQLGSRVAAVAFSPEGSYLATGTLARRVQVWDATIPAPQWAQVAFWELSFLITGVAFSPDGRYLAAASAAGVQVRQRNASATAWPEAARVHANVHSVAFSPDGRYLASVGEDRMGRLWQVATGAPWLEAARFPTDTTVSSVAFSPEGRYLAAVAMGGVKVVEVPSGREVARLASSELLRDVAFSPDSLRLATAGSQPHLWEASGGSDTTLRVRLTIAPVAAPDTRSFQVHMPAGVADSRDSGVFFAVEPAEGIPYPYAYPYGPYPYPYPHPYFPPLQPAPYPYPPTVYPYYPNGVYGFAAGIGGLLL